MKNPIIAFLLGFFPGGGLLYLGKAFRGLAYMLGEFFLIALTFFMISVGVGGEVMVIVFAGVFLYIVNLVDTGITASKLLKGKQPLIEENKTVELDYERFRTILLSFIPGVGHFHLGLMNRGLTFLAASLGLGIMVTFIAVMTNRGEFLVFLLLFPVIWVYSFFDATQQLNKKQRGEELVDRTILEDFEKHREDGKKSKTIATILSTFPGAGHLYLGLQRRGIQLMAAFLFSIYILDVLRLGIFLFLIPIIWFYSFFDGLQKASRYGEEELEDVPIIAYFINHQRWIGIGLVLIGLYYMTTSIILPSVSPMLSNMINIDLWYWFDRYFQTGIVCILLIGGGLKLLGGNKNKNVKKAEGE
ncbi:hypothetical protein [Cytobacillus purgationiresistens]|uniref:Multi-TM2 domain-containing protein n=1 Tax=Cytobacillus purgationiresistens TaxID=863449 RepID=A0ABU0AR81_9BACI|nr:hypothetical protein [Cytobacillus purgationiresistens]MDQ0273540.1 hypothetical protein [Cytobacillus purgationiresistens]